MWTVATSPETDINRVPCIIPVSNVGLGSSSNNYPGNVFGTSKIYYSTLETSAAPTTKYRFYKWSPLVSQAIGSTDIINDSVYQTQCEMFSKKMTVSEVRVYGEPWIAGNAFTIDLIGSAGSDTAISGGSYTFTAGTNLTVGDDYAWYNPTIAPTYALGVSIKNAGTTNHTINKIEIDYEPAGK